MDETESYSIYDFKINTQVDLEIKPIISWELWRLLKDLTERWFFLPGWNIEKAIQNQFKFLSIPISTWHNWETIIELSPWKNSLKNWLIRYGQHQNESHFAIHPENLIQEEDKKVAKEFVMPKMEILCKSFIFLFSNSIRDRHHNYSFFFQRTFLGQF